MAVSARVVGTVADTESTDRYGYVAKDLFENDEVVCAFGGVILDWGGQSSPGSSPRICWGTNVPEISTFSAYGEEYPSVPQRVGFPPSTSTSNIRTKAWADEGYDQLVVSFDPYWRPHTNDWQNSNYVVYPFRTRTAVVVGIQGAACYVNYKAAAAYQDWENTNTDHRGAGISSSTVARFPNIWREGDPWPTALPFDYDTRFECWGGGRFGLDGTPFCLLPMSNRLATLPTQYDGLYWPGYVVGTCSLLYGTGGRVDFTPPAGFTLLGSANNDTGTADAHEVFVFFKDSADDYLTNYGWSVDDPLLEATVSREVPWAMHAHVGMSLKMDIPQAAVRYTTEVTRRT